MTGYSLEEAVGKQAINLLHNPDTDKRPYDAVRDKLMQGEYVSFEIQNVTKNGEKVWLSVQVSPTLDEHGEVARFVAIQTDITEKVKAQQELEKLSLVASKTNNGVLITSKDWKIEWANDGFTRLMGYTLNEAVGKRPSELLHCHKTDKTSFTAVEAKLLGGEAITFEILNTKKNGEEVWLSVEVTPVLGENGEPCRFIEVQTDITALKKSELELGKLAKDLCRQNNDLQQFNYIVSHNLRAPVANALGLAQLLKKINKHSPLYDLSLVNLEKSVSQLDAVLKDMNTILSVRDGNGNLEHEQVHVAAVVQEALASLQEPFQNCGGVVINAVAEDLVVRANRAYLYSIFYNLLSNAVKYRAEDRPLQVQIKSFGSSEEGAFISFSDNGSGFDMSKAKDKVFKLYKRFHTDRKGRGIGLYLIKAHLEAVGGHIEVTSQIGKGTRFLIYLPKIEHENIYS